MAKITHQGRNAVAINRTPKIQQKHFTASSLKGIFENVDNRLINSTKEFIFAINFGVFHTILL